MDTAGTEAQVVVFATRANGEVTWAPFAGVVTVMADAVAVHTTKDKRAEKKGFIKVPQLKWRCDFGVAVSATRTSGENSPGVVMAALFRKEFLRIAALPCAPLWRSTRKMERNLEIRE